MIGKNTGTIKIQGSCSKFDPNSLMLFGSNDPLNLNQELPPIPEINVPSSGMCELKIPISVSINDNETFILHFFEIIGILVIIWAIVVAGIYLAVRHYRVKCDYQQL